MLYGMDTAKENDRQLKERAHYAPWNAGKFGGSLELETNGNTYRIERVFDPKSAAKDRLQCYLLTNGVKETELLPTPGEHLLGIPKDAFLRTVFLSGRDSGSAEGILPRLNQCINGSTDTDLYGNALTLLTAAKKKYKPDRGSGGRLEQLQNQRKSAERAEALPRLKGGGRGRRKGKGKRREKAGGNPPAPGVSQCIRPSPFAAKRL